MVKWKSVFHNYRQNKSAFTLIELIVVLVILGIILAITVPAVTSYIDDAKDVTDDINISVLNKSTQAYKVYLYNELGKVPTDAFYDLTTDEARQQRLLDRSLLDEILVSTRGATYTWDIASQKWTKNGQSGGGSGDTGGMDLTILRDIYGKTEADFNTWAVGYYEYGDVITVVDNEGVTRFFKWIGEKTYVNQSPISSNYLAFWKEVTLAYNKDICYEKGDIIQYQGNALSGSIKGKYFRGVADHSSNTYVYINAGCPSTGVCSSFNEDKVFNSKNADGSPKYFQEVEYKNGAWVNVK